MAETLKLTMQQALSRAELAVKKGDVDFAKQLYAAILQKQPDHLLAKKSLQKLAKDSQRNQAGLTVQTDPSPDQMNNLLSLYNSGEMSKAEQALKAYDRAIQLNPEYAGAHFNRGVALQNLGRLEEAIKSYAKAIQLKPDYADAYNNRGATLKSLGQLEEALKSYNQAIQLKPDNASAYNNRGNALQGLSRLEEAIKSYYQAIQLKPEYAEAHNNLGVLFQQTGQLDKAVRHFRKALQAKPDFTEAYVNIGAVKKYSEVGADIQAMQKIFYSKKSQDREKMLIGFSLGKAFENLKQYQKSFQFIQRANHLHRSSYSYSISDDTALFNKLKTICSKEFFAVQDDPGPEPRENRAARPILRPIFIIGMLRSGTTLVEQILASHPYVLGAGELNTLPELVNNLCRKKNSGQFPEGLSGFDQHDFKRLGSAYLRKLAAYRSKNERYITDKMPHNFLNIGLIKKILPKAKIIHCKRDPMGTCFSIFKTYFTIKNSHPYAYEMTELGRYYNLYADLMKHWSKLLPGFVYDIEYEKLVTDQETQTRKLLTYCGLPWDPACLAFHKTSRRVITASSVQVRRPMYKDSVELWKEHAKQLEPLSRAIGIDG